MGAAQFAQDEAAQWVISEENVVVLYFLFCILKSIYYRQEEDGEEFWQLAATREGTTRGLNSNPNRESSRLFF